MQASIEQRGPDLFCRSPDTRPSEIRIDGEQARAALNGWAARYDAAVAQANAGALLGIGRELFDWLDPTGWASAWALGTRVRSIEIRGRIRSRRWPVQCSMPTRAVGLRERQPGR